MASDTSADIQPIRRRRGRRRHASRLRPVGVRPPLHVYLRDLWQRRHFIRMQAWANALGQHRGSALGSIWLVVTPILDGLVYFFIFGILFQGRKDIPNFFGYLVIGIFLFTFTSRSITACSKCISSDKGLIRAFAFPRATLPVATVWREMIAVLPVVYVLVILLLVIPPKGKLGWTWLLVPIVLFLQVLFNLGVGFVAARLGARFPDLQYLVPYAMRLLLYTSGIMFAIERFDAHPPLGEIVRNNPIYEIVDMYRSVLLENVAPPLGQWVSVSAWAVGSVLVGFIFFWQAEVKYARAVLE